jgi:hypothetical protein
VVIFFSISPKLRRSCFSSDSDSRNSRPRSSPAWIVDYPPHSTTD